MKIAIAGGGPGGLYFATLMKTLDPSHDITVWERNAPDDTFGFGVVFSDETLGSIEGADRVVHERMEKRFARWTDIDVAVTDREGDTQSFTVGGQGFAAMSRKELLQILQERVAELGVTVHYRTETRRPRRAAVVVRPGTRFRRAQLPDPRPSTPTGSGPRSTGGTTSTSGSAPTWSSRRSSSSSSRRSGAPCRSTATRSPSRVRPSSSRCTRTCGVAQDSTAPSPRASRPAPLTSTPSSGSQRSSLTSCRATRSSPTTPSGSTSTPCATRAGTTATWCCSATPRTPPTSPSAPARSSPWRTPSPSPPAFTSTRRWRRRWRPTRPSASRSWSRPSALPRRRSSGSRTSGCTPIRPPRSSCSICSPGPDGSPSRTSGSATPSSRRGWRRSSRAASTARTEHRRCSSRCASVISS